MLSQKWFTELHSACYSCVCLAFKNTNIPVSWFFFALPNSISDYFLVIPIALCLLFLLLIQPQLFFEVPPLCCSGSILFLFSDFQFSFTCSVVQLHQSKYSSASCYVKNSCCTFMLPKSRVDDYKSSLNGSGQGCHSR